MNMNGRAPDGSMLPAIGPGLRRRSSTIFVAIGIAVAMLAVRRAAIAADRDQGRGQDKGQHWVAPWATSPAANFVYVPPVPPVYPPGAPTNFAPANIQPDLGFPFPANNHAAANQPFRSIVKLDLWGNRMRFRFSNVFGTQPVTFNAVTVALQEYSGNVVEDTIRPVTFSGSRSVTIPVGQEIWSDGTLLSWVGDADDPGDRGRNLAVSYSVQGSSGPMTYHSGANMTSFITTPGSGDPTGDADVFAYEFTTTSWFFLAAVDVMAAADTVVVCAFGDSITDGTHTTLNTNDRWSNVLSRRLHNAYGNKVSVVNEAIGGNRVVNPAVGKATSGPAAGHRLVRGALGAVGATPGVWVPRITHLRPRHPPPP